MSTASSTHPAAAAAAFHEPPLTTVSGSEMDHRVLRFGLLGRAHDARHVVIPVHQRQLGSRGMAAFHLQEGLIQLGIGTERGRDRAQPAHVLGMTPARVVPAAVGVRE